MLLGIGGLYGAGATDPLLLAFGAAVLAPVINKCGTAVVPDGVKPVNFCPPPSTKIIDFKLPSRGSPCGLAKYRKTVDLMNHILCQII